MEQVTTGGRPVTLTRDAIYPESPRWRDGLLWFSDVHDYAVKTVDVEGRVRLVTKVPGRPAGLGFLPDRRLLIAGALDRRLHVWDGRVLTEFADLSEAALGLLNDMVVDSRGRAYVGDTGFNLMAGEPERAGHIILVDTATSAASPAVRVAHDGVLFPNGSAISADGRRLWVAESAADRVSTFAVADDGSLTRTGAFAIPGFPDGLCLDETDGVWVALLKRGEFQHLTSAGVVDATIAMPGHLAVACALGGSDRRDLYLCSAETTMQDLARGVSAGQISTIRVTHSGAGQP